MSEPDVGCTAVGCTAVRCIECLKANPKKAPEAMARLGCAVCNFEREAGRFVTLTFRRECLKFRPAPADVVRGREVWLEAQR